MAVALFVDMKNPVVNIIREEENGHDQQCRMLSLAVGNDRIHFHFETPDELNNFINSLQAVQQIRG